MVRGVSEPYLGGGRCVLRDESRASAQRTSAGVAGFPGIELSVQYPAVCRRLFCRALGYALSDSFRLGPGTQNYSWASFLQSGHDSCGITCAVADRRLAVAVLAQNVCRQPKEQFYLAYGWAPSDRGII